MSVYSKRRVPEGYRRFPDGSAWVPSGRTSRVGANPSSDWASWGKTTKATIFVGLQVGRGGTRFLVGDPISDRAVYGLVYAVRIGQVGTKHGASFVQQKGHYIPKEAREPGPETKRRGNSMQVIIFPATGEGWSLFKKNIGELAEAMLDDLIQESVIIEFVRNGKVDDLGQYEWVPVKKRRGRGRR